MKITEKVNFSEYNDIIVLKFWSETCSPCRDLDWQLEKLESEELENVSILKVDVDENIEIMEDLLEKGLIRPFMSIPTTFIFFKGEVRGVPIIWSDIGSIRKVIEILQEEL